MRVKRIETVFHWVKDPEASSRWYARLLGVPPFDIPPGRLVTLNDPDGNIVGLIDNSKGGMPEQF